MSGRDTTSDGFEGSKLTHGEFESVIPGRTLATVAVGRVKQGCVRVYRELDGDGVGATGDRTSERDTTSSGFEGSELTHGTFESVIPGRTVASAVFGSVKRGCVRVYQRFTQSS
jgi:hypothetical protein